MSMSVFSVVNQVAAVYGRPPMDPPIVDLYRWATGIEKDDDFVRRLLELLKVCRAFPVPADFAVELDPLGFPLLDEKHPAALAHQAQGAINTEAKEAAHA